MQQTTFVNALWVNDFILLSREAPLATVAMMNSAMKAAGGREATEGVSSPSHPDSNQRRSVSSEKDMESTPDVSVRSIF